MAAFDGDRHWMPSHEPASPGNDESRRLVQNAKKRLEEGDDPSPVARDLLLAGVEPRIVRKALDGAGIAAKKNRRMARSLSLMSVLFGAIWLSRDKRDPQAIGDAHSDVDAWEARFRTPDPASSS